MYKALVTDLDGTAISISSKGEDITNETQITIRSAIQNNKKITCATGREWIIAKPIIAKLGLTSPCIVEGGTRIIDPITEKVVWEKSLSSGAPTEILAAFKSIHTNGLIVHSSNINRQPVADVSSAPQSLRFLYLLAVDKESAAIIANKINTDRFAVAHTTPSWHGKELMDIHVTDWQGTKEYAIRAWQEIEGITIEETIGMGDSGNDIPIFQSAGHKIAVGNATPDLKELADYVAPSVNDQALKHVIDTFLLAS